MDHSMREAVHDGRTCRRVELITGGRRRRGLDVGGEGPDRRGERGAEREHFGCRSTRRREPWTVDGIASTVLGDAKMPGRRDQALFAGAKSDTMCVAAERAS
jgi:hypothetical protein